MNKIDSFSKKEQDAFVFDLINALVACQSMGEAALFLQDILTLNEMKTLAKRLQIAKPLLAGMTYEEIEETLHVSHSTVAKISAWMTERGDGFRKIIEKLPAQKENIKDEYTEWDKLKRGYSIYFWPELLLEEIVKSANK